MERTSIYENLVHDSKKVKMYLDESPGLEKHMDFSLQFDFSEQNQWSQIVLYDSLLMFLTHLSPNYVGLKQYLKGGKGKFMFCLPKKAFREYVNQTLSSYSDNEISYSDDEISRYLLILGKNKVATKRKVVVDFFTLVEVETFEDYWCLLFHHTTAPYICSFPILGVLALQRIIPSIDTDLLSLKEMRDERRKAGLDIPPMMNIVDIKESGDNT